MNSMTGFGHGEVECNGNKVSVDIKSVNGRFLDITTKMPKSFLCFEESIKNQIKKQITRGTLDVFVTITKASGEDVEMSLNSVLCEKIYSEAEKLSKSTKIPNELTLKELIRVDGILQLQPKELDVNFFAPMLHNATQEALNGLMLMRKCEGENLKMELLNMFQSLKLVVEKIVAEIPKSVNEYQRKLNLRITEALKGVEIDENKLINEVAFFVDKSDVNEEIARLYSHLNQADALLNSNSPIGKKLEFVTQEITREINTLGSKSGSISITNLVLEAKNINESIKEQIRNVE